MSKLEDYYTLSVIRKVGRGELEGGKIVKGNGAAFTNPTIIRCALYVSSGDLLFFEVDKTNPTASRWKRDDLAAVWYQSKHTEELLSLLTKGE